MVLQKSVREDQQAASSSATDNSSSGSADVLRILREHGVIGQVSFSEDEMSGFFGGLFHEP